MQEAILQQLFCFMERLFILEYRKTLDLVLNVYYDGMDKSFKIVLREEGSMIVGIDLGTTNSLIAYYKEDSETHGLRSYLRKLLKYEP